MAMDSLVPETKVLAIASHVVYGYVGNTMATFVMQALGCDVSALNTVHYSNHLGYGQVKGTRASAQEINDIYEGLKQSSLTDFDILLSGYAPGAEAVNSVGAIARDLKSRSSAKPGTFFWVMDPVMGDQGRLYVNEDVVPAYKSLLWDADLIVPNQFEAEVLSDVRICNLATLKQAVAKLHAEYHIPHIVVTSVQFSSSDATLSVIGSTRRTDNTPRVFKIDVPNIACFFSGTGDMFAALTVARLREEVTRANVGGTASWLSEDEVHTLDLPLAKAIEKVLASMQQVLGKTKKAMDIELGVQTPQDNQESSEKAKRLQMTKAAEVRLVRNVTDLMYPKVLYTAHALP